MPGDRNGSGGLGKYTRIGALPPEDSPVTTENPPKEALKSHRFLDLIRGNGWRPFALRPPTLLLFLFSTIGLAVIIEALNYTSTRIGGLTFADSDGEFSTAQIFAYRYLPQMIIVLYGVGWAAVDLDVKRLEPYFQLSKPGGASASDSILLHYPFDFLALVPIDAAKKMHWNVFAAGMALVLITWVITPLQSSLLTIEPVTGAIPTRFALIGELKPYSSQEADFGSSSFFCSSYGVTWLGERVPEFMNHEVIAMPFAPVRDGYGDKRYNESWIAVTRVYQTHVDCVPANITKPGKNGNGVYNFTTDNCFHSVNPLPDNGETETRNLMYIGYGNRSGVDQNLRKSECMVKNIFLGVWARSRLQPNGSKAIDISGIFCRAKYSYANASITIDTFDNSIRGYNLIGQPKPLTAEDKVIDIDSFERCLGSGRTVESADDDRLPAVAPATTIRYEHWNLSYPTWQVGYAIGLEKGMEFDDFKDPEVFGDAMNKTHKLLFNYAVREIRSTMNGTKPSDFVNGTVIVRKEGVVVVTEIAHLLAGFLSVVALCVAGVIFYSCSRRNNLHSDPDTLATAMSLVGQSPQLLKDFEGTDNCPDISKCIKRRRYMLGPWDGEDGHRLDIVDVDDATTSEGPGSSGSCTKLHRGRGIWPWEFSAGIGVGTTIFSAGLLALLVVLFSYSQKHSGLPTLSNHELVVRLIYSFIPTVAVTFVEPVWVIITRYLALYQPWTELSRGHTSSAASLGLKYTNLPPALIAPRALLGRHYILSLASTVVLASNGLTVAMGGLFDNGLRQTNTTLALKFPLSASIDTQIQVTKSMSANVNGTFAKDGEEHWLIANTNFTRNTTLPAWVAPGFYFLPFERNSNTTAGSFQDLRSARTWGFGINLTCELLEGGIYRQQSWAGVRGSPDPKPAVALNVTVPMANGGSVRCGNPSAGFKVDSLKSGRFSGEYLYGLGPTDRGSKMDEDFCNSLLVVGWSRGSMTLGRRNDSTVSYTMGTGTYANTTLLCMQRISSAEFNVVVDGRGRVREFERLTPFTYDDSSLLNSSAITSFKAQLSTIVRTNPYTGRDTGQMHNGRSCHTFPHYVVNRAAPVPICDSERPPPSLRDVQQGLQGFYSWFAAIVIGQNSERIFRSTTKDGGEAPQMTGRRIYLQNCVSMDPVLFYIATALLGFSAIASVITFTARPKRFLPRLPNTLAAEIGFFYASEAVEDTAGTAHMTSAMREKHLAKLGWEYGYGKFIGKDGKLHLGVERMGPIDDFKEASGTRSLGTAEAGEEQGNP